MSTTEPSPSGELSAPRDGEKAPVEKCRSCGVPIGPGTNRAGGQPCLACAVDPADCGAPIWGGRWSCTLPKGHAGHHHHEDGRGTLAEMFMRLAPTVREDIADSLGVGVCLPDRHPDAAYEILRRVRKRGLIVALRAAVKAEVNRG